MRALDRFTLRITLGVPNPRFVYQLADAVICGAVAREVVEAYSNDITAHPVRTGPFRLETWRRGSRIVLGRSTSYRATVYDGTPGDDPELQRIAASRQGRTLPLVDEVVVDIVEEDQPRWLSFLNGDYAWLALPGTFAPTAAPLGQLAPFLRKKGVRLT